MGAWRLRGAPTHHMALRGECPVVPGLHLHPGPREPTVYTAAQSSSLRRAPGTTTSVAFAVGRLCVALAAAMAVLCVEPTGAVAIDVKYLLRNAGADADAMALARFQTLAQGRQRFEVKVSFMPPGTYTVLVDEAEVETLSVDERGEGRLWLQGAPLCFDPRGQSVSVKAPGAQGKVYFVSTWPAAREGEPESPAPGASPFCVPRHLAPPPQEAGALDAN